MPYRLGG
ncbi:hypothetical protein YPPY94_3332, partial [Yersinia pestis PY-94]